MYKKMCVLVIFASAAGCSTWDKLDNTERGAVIGGGTGAVVGSAVTGGEVGGALVGGALGAAGGGLIGREEDRREARDRYHRRYYD